MVVPGETAPGFFDAYGEWAQTPPPSWDDLRWLVQENRTEAEASVVRDNLVRFDALPLYVRVPDLPALTPGARVRLGLGRVDLFSATLETRFLGVALA